MSRDHFNVLAFFILYQLERIGESYNYFPNILFIFSVLNIKRNGIIFKNLIGRQFLFFDRKFFKGLNKKYFMKATILLVSIAVLAFKNSFYNDKSLKNTSETASYIHANYGGGDNITPNAVEDTSFVSKAIKANQHEIMM